MEESRLKRIEEIYQATVDQPPEKRARFLDESCGDDEELRREVESLLRYEDGNANFIDSPPGRLAAEIFSKDGQKGKLVSGQVRHYRIRRLLGEGGMGEVYLADDTRLLRRVALKVFPEDIIDDSERLMRFEREAQAASALNHPNILTVHEFGEDDGVHFIASEFVDGETLRRRLGTGRLDASAALDIAIQVSSALAAAHEAGITHRDIKPENIMIRRDGYVKVLDFGLVKLAQEKAPRFGSGSEDPTILHHTRPGAIMGTAAYMSPEQARGKTVGARTDIWSLGVVLYEMLTGQRPFAGETQADKIVSVLSTEPPPISSLVEELPAGLESIVSKALSKTVEGRYQTAKELRTDLERVRKQIEFHESGPGNSESQGRDEAGGRTVEQAVPTGDNSARPTSGGDDESSVARASSWPSRSFEVVVRQARTHKVSYALVALVVIALFSTAIYFVFVTPRAGVRIDSIAVLPFVNQSGNADLDYLSDGLSESLIDRLAELPQLKVISRNSSFKFRDANPDLRQIASQLGVRAIVTGSVNRVGDDLAIRIDIIDTASDRQLAGGQYRRKIGDIVRIQNELAQAAIEPLRLKLTDSQTKRLADSGTENSEAYRYYLNGLVEYYGPQDVHSRALEYYEQAVKLDPDFALAYAEIAWIYWSRANESDNPNELMPKAKAATKRALEIDPDLPKAHVLQAMMHEYDFDWPAAENEYRRAIELSPNLDFARNNYAFFLSVMDRQTEALAQLEEEGLRDPIDRRRALLQKGIILTQARRFDDALRAYQEAQAVEPNRDISNFSLAYAYAGKGLYGEAAAYYKKSADLLGGEDKYSQPLVYLAATYAKIPEKRNEARTILTKIEAMDQYASPALLAIVYSALDNNDKAMELLEQAYIKRDLLLRFVGTGYEYDGLRGDPRFKDLLKRSNLSQ